MKEIPAFPSLEEAHPRQAGAYRSGHSPSSPARMAGLLPAAGMEPAYRQDRLQLCLSQLPCCLHLEQKANSQEQTLGAVGGLWRSLPSGQKGSLWGWQNGAPQRVQPKGGYHTWGTEGWMELPTAIQGPLLHREERAPGLPELNVSSTSNTHLATHPLAHPAPVAGACLL